MVQRWWRRIQSSHHRISTCRLSPHCHPVEKSCQRAPIPSYNHFNLLFTPTLYFISAIWCIRMKELLGRANSQWLWWDRCPGKLTKLRRAKKRRLTDDWWTFSCHLHWIGICILHLSPRIAAIQTFFTGIQDNPALIAIHILGDFTGIYTPGIFVVRHITHCNLYLFHINEYVKTS